MRERLIEAMRKTFGEDERRIKHALAVLDYAEKILKGERADRLRANHRDTLRPAVAGSGPSAETRRRKTAKGEGADRLTVQAAAILHDIGIREAERKHGSSAPRFQEMEGPAIARRILEECGVDHAVVEHVCRIVGSHHSAKGIDSPEFRIIWDADWLVNIPAEHGDLNKRQLAALIAKVFRTETGRRIARETLLGEGG